MAYEYKIYSLEVYKSESPVPQIVANVMALSEDGVMLVNKSVVMDASVLDKEIVETDSVEETMLKIVNIVSLDPSLDTAALDKLDAENKAKQSAWDEAQAILSKLEAKVGETSINAPLSMGAVSKMDVVLK